MSDAALQLRKAVYDRLAGDAVLVGLLGGARIHDEAPRGQGGPHVTFERWQADDASVPERRMTRHEAELALWPGEGAASARALAIAARIETLLHDASLMLTGHRLVFLFWSASVAGRDAQTRTPKLTMSFAALTESS
jgi:hypothetical protein